MGVKLDSSQLQVVLTPPNSPETKPWLRIGSMHDLGFETLEIFLMPVGYVGWKQNCCKTSLDIEANIWK